ncbi:zinc finger protein-like 1 [Pogona vitticeps]
MTPGKAESDELQRPVSTLTRTSTAGGPCSAGWPKSSNLFHWSCLNETASQLPKNTAPAGYQCPSCQGPIFPPANLVSPVASVLREKLSTVNWARAGLGLPLIDEIEAVQERFSRRHRLHRLVQLQWAPDGRGGPPAKLLRPHSAFASPQPPQQSLNNGGVQEHHTVIAMNALASSPVTINTD